MAASTPINLAKGQLKDAARVCARAFLDDLQSIYFIPHDQERRRLLHHIFIFLLKHGRRYGQVLATSERLEGVVIALRGPNAAISNWRALRSGALTMQRRLGPEIMMRLRRAAAFSGSIHRKHVPGDHIYLPVLCVEPQYQGQGLARVLLDPVLDEARSLGLPCFLETHQESNLGLYQKFGFEVVEETLLPGTKIRHWALIRPAGC